MMERESDDRRVWALAARRPGRARELLRSTAPPYDHPMGRKPGPCGPTSPRSGCESRRPGLAVRRPSQPAAGAPPYCVRTRSVGQAPPGPWTDPMFNDHDLLEFLLVAAPGLLATTVLFAVLWVRAREGALRSQVSPRRSARVRVRKLTHVVHAVDAIAIEVERISEAQRFTALALAERSSGAIFFKRVRRAGDHPRLTRTFDEGENDPGGGRVRSWTASEARGTVDARGATSQRPSTPLPIEP